MKANNKKNILLGIWLAIIIFIIYCFFPVLNYREDIEKSAGRIVLYDRFWEIITDKQKKNWYFIKLKKEEFQNFEDLKIIKNILKIEDKNFYNHFWVNVFSKLRAIKNNIINKKIVSGWSTITEQYLKNKYFLKQKRNYLQKTREAFLALNFSIYYDKWKILEKYLNEIYFWNNIYWLKSASKVYFNKNINELNDEEITLLISLIHNPWIKYLKQKSFSKYFEKIKNRLWFNFERKIFKLKKINNIDKFPFVTKRALEELDFLDKKEIIIKTTIDSNFQEFSKNMLNDTLKSLKWKNVTNWAVLWFNPRTMEVLIYQGSKGFYDRIIDWQVDVLTSKRQLGSTLKPFLYLKALKNWAESDDFIVDIENEYNSFQKWKTYISENYSLKQYGLVRFKKAIWNSLNNASVRLAKELWLVEVWEFFKNYWIKLDKQAEHYGYSLVLWNPSISLENLATSYINLLPDFDLEKDRKLNFILNQNKKNYGSKKIDKNKFILYDILKNPDNRDISFWVNSILNTSIYQAVKTGTSSNFRDNVVISYNPDFILAIWIWNNDNSSMKWVTWITWAWYLWHQIIEKAIKKRIILDLNYETPKSVKKVNYCLDKKCFRKEQIFKKTWKEFKSSIIDREYYNQDIFEKLDDYEFKKLKNLNFNIKK